MPHTEDLFNVMEKGYTRNKRGELKPDKLRFGRKPTFKNLGVELRTLSRQVIDSLIRMFSN